MRLVYKTIRLLIGFFLFSCKTDKSIIIDYLENETTNKIIIAEKSYDLKAFETFSGWIREFEGEKYNTGSKYYCINNTIQNDILRKKFTKSKTAIKYWNKNDFKNVKVDSILTYQQYFNAFKPKLKYYKHFKDYTVYTLSNIIKYNDSICFFRVTKNKVNTSHTYFNKAIVYKKTNAKWIKIEEIESTDLP